MDPALNAVFTHAEKEARELKDEYVSVEHFLLALAEEASSGREVLTTLGADRAAIRRVHRYSRGVPRLINAVCDKALLCGYVEGTQLLKRKHLRRAIRELEGKFT